MADPTKLRRYSPVWKVIKAKGTCTLAVHPAAVRRVKKGVIQEKDKDKGFKFINEYDKAFLKITVIQVDISTAHITFELKQRIGLEPLIGIGE